MEKEETKLVVEPLDPNIKADRVILIVGKLREKKTVKTLTRNDSTNDANDDDENDLPDLA